MNRAKHQRTRRAVAQEFTHKKLCSLGADFRVFESHLRRESIILEPVQQLPTIGADNINLREMDMGVDKPRHDKVVFIVLDFRRRA